MNSQQIIDTLNNKIKERLEHKKELKASELIDLTTVELMWLAVYSTNEKAIWTVKKIESSKIDSKDHHGKHWSSPDFILGLRLQL